MKRRLAKIALLAGMFFLPLGFDVAFKYALDITGSFLFATLIFYCVSLAFFISSYLSKDKLKSDYLMLCGMFFQPLGFDILLGITYHLVGSYWLAIKIFYVISACFFSAYFYLSGHNPIDAAKNYIRRVSFRGK